MRALLGLMRANEPLVRETLRHCIQLLEAISSELYVLEEGHGEEELIKDVADELAELRTWGVVSG